LRKEVASSEGYSYATPIGGTIRGTEQRGPGLVGNLKEGNPYTKNEVPPKTGGKGREGSLDLGCRREEPLNGGPGNHYTEKAWKKKQRFYDAEDPYGRGKKVYL